MAVAAMPGFTQWVRDQWARLCGETPRTDVEKQVFFDCDHGRPNWPRFDTHLAALERVINDQPPFANPGTDYRKVATHLTWVFAFLDELASGRLSDPEYLIRMGRASALGHKFDWPGCGNLAQKMFKMVLEKDPEHGVANYHLGIFLAGTALLHRDAVPYLQRARAKGIVGATFILALVNASLGQKTEALELLNEYLNLEPGDLHAQQARASIQCDEFTVHTFPNLDRPSSRAQ